jgi:predicted glycosyltransferase
MELERLCKRVTNIPNSISRAYTKDITKILDDMFFEYDIVYKETDQKVNKDILLRKFLSVFDNSQDEQKICIGVSQNGNKCCRRVREGSNYCKTHQYLEYKSQIVEKQNSQDVFVIENSDLPKSLDKFKNHTCIQIDGTFYYEDDSFVYDKNTLERVGYKEGSKYVLTDDPFVLCL